jgi:hypothetical protein
VSAQSFFKRRDKYFFAKIAKNHEKDLLTYFVSNFKNGVGYVGDMINEDGERNYLDHKRIQESIHRVFSIDINKLNEQGELFDNLFKSVNGQVPLVVKVWMQEEISLETVVILNSIFGFIDRESVRISDTIIWPDTKRKIEKYTPFVNYNKDKCMKLLTNVFI